jgi:hypothetical protein
MADSAAGEVMSTVGTQPAIGDQHHRPPTPPRRVCLALNSSCIAALPRNGEVPHEAGIETSGRARTIEAAKAAFQMNYTRWLVWSKLED